MLQDLEKNMSKSGTANEALNVKHKNYINDFDEKLLKNI